MVQSQASWPSQSLRIESPRTACRDVPGPAQAPADLRRMPAPTTNPHGYVTEPVTGRFAPERSRLSSVGRLSASRRSEHQRLFGERLKLVQPCLRRLHAPPRNLDTASLWKHIRNLHGKSSRAEVLSRLFSQLHLDLPPRLRFRSGNDVPVTPVEPLRLGHRFDRGQSTGSGGLRASITSARNSRISS